VWNLRSSRTRPVPIRLVEDRFRQSLEYAAPDYAKRCAPAGLGKKLTITASAKLGDTDLAIALDAGDASFQTCVRDLLRKYLHDNYGGYRTKADGSPEPYFRADAAVHATVTVEPKP
jgi:hypothetical protein